MVITIQIVLIIVLIVSIGSMESKRKVERETIGYTLVALASIIGLVITII